MPNPLRGEAAFEADEKVYRVKFHWSAACEFEHASGRVLSDALLDIAHEKLSATSLRAMLWAGLQEHHPDLTLKLAGRLIDAMGRKEAQRILGVALRYYFPELEEEQPETAEADPSQGTAVPPTPAPSD